MNDNQERQDVYIFPPNFIESGTFFGGMLKVRNVVEAGILALAVGVPVFYIETTLTIKIIILCLTALPLAIFSIVGIAGESLSSFAFIFFQYLRNKRVVGKMDEETTDKKISTKHALRNKMLKQKGVKERRKSTKAVERNAKKNTGLGRKKEKTSPQTTKRMMFARTSVEPEHRFLNPVAQYTPIEKQMAKGKKGAALCLIPMRLCLKPAWKGWR